MNNKVIIIMPAFNASKPLAKTIRGIPEGMNCR
jgi:glycosyltransferase involved in cell wall biosynthesis